MGSLMAGWSSQVLADDDKVRYMRNRSLTKEDVDAFWRQQKKPDAEIVVVSSPPLASSPRAERPMPMRPSTLPHARSSPPAMTGAVHGNGDAVASPSTSRDWWTRSSWAFLNESPSRRADGDVGQGAAAAV